MNLYITPHPPIILSKIGKGEERNAIQTIRGMEQIAQDIKKASPKTIAIITPHGNVFSDALCINIEEHLHGDLSKFRCSLAYNFDNDTQKATEICTELVASGISCLALNKHNAKHYDISCDLDHGVLVPLYFIQKEYTDFKLIHISIGYLSKTELYKAGMIISDILGNENVLIVSGDLSHRLSDTGSYEYDEMGEVYDRYIVDLIKDNSYVNILDIDHDMVERAGQCAQKSLELFIGALEGYETDSEVFSYEGPFGVGYMTAKITRGKKNEHSVLNDYLERTKNTYDTMLENEDEYVTLARNTINQYIANGIKIDMPEDLTNKLYDNKNGIFVSIKKEGRLRGCIGTISPTKENIAQEIIDNAISASTRDPRFNPIEEHELGDLVISVDVLFPPEDIDSKEKLDVKRYGVIVSSGIKKGLLLPNLDGVDSVDQQISIALEKAGIKQYEDYSLQRFEVVRHK